jgi:hypothetical protein
MSLIKEINMCSKNSCIGRECQCNKHDGLGGIHHTCQQKKPHKHAELIKAWAEGAQIQIFNEIQDKWEDTNPPWWITSCTYRVKPEPKPDVVKLGYAFKEGNWLSVNIEIKTKKDANVEFIFDGETDILKDVKLIK